MRVMSGYSYNYAAGHVEEVMDKIVECGYPAAPLSDMASTFGFVRWRKLAKKKELKPIYGVTLNISPAPSAKKPPTSEVSFFAKERISDLHELVEIATNQFRYTPLLNYTQINNASGVIKVIGHRANLEYLIPEGVDTYVALSPAVYPGYFKEAKERGFKFIHSSANRYTGPDDRFMYETLIGINASTQTYPQHILNKEEWAKAVRKSGATDEDLQDAWDNFIACCAECNAPLPQGTLLTPKKEKTLRELCIEGAQRLGCNLADPTYAARLDRELALIDDKGFEDYFYIVAEMIQWSKQHMLVGPGRGSSAGSLVCYLLGITMIDPIPFGLLFERFIDINRKDLPDIDIDFHHILRDKVFDHMEEIYGKERVARLGTVMRYKPRSVIKTAATALGVPFWKTDPVLDSMIETSSGDARALNAVEDTFKLTPAGRKLIEEFPEMAVCTRMEGHPSTKSQHAAGILVTERPVKEYVAVDSQTGGTYCDKKDAEELELLKIDALGLTQLSIFQDCLRLIGKSNEWLDTIPLDDNAAFEILNNKKFSGIFQFEGAALQRVTKDVRVTAFEDIVSLTALARPGPLSSGSTSHWVKRKKGAEPVEIPHPLFEPYLGETFGVVVYQEQIMSIVREIGGLSWEDTSNLRKAMSKSLGREFFDQYGDPFKAECVKRGIPFDVAFKMWDGLCSFGAWCLSGDTKLRNPYPNQHEDSRFFTLKELYDRQGEVTGAGPKRRQKLFCWDGEGLKPTANVLVTYSGQKETWLVETASGKKIRATMEHQFLCDDGEYRRLEELSVGDNLMSKGECQPTERHKVKGTGKGRHNWRQKEKDGIPFLHGKRGTYNEVRYRSELCEECNERPVQEVHHLNGNHEDHRAENLKPVCRICHKRLHKEQGLQPIGFTRGYGIVADPIVSISDPKVEDVYDVSMPAPHHNFLAEDIVVHNCFNKSHAVAYGLISYQCCYLKAHYPLEFAAATLTHSDNADAQLRSLRELRAEGIDYLPVHPEFSTESWQVANVDGQKKLIGPLQNVKGIGAKIVQQIISARQLGLPLPARAAKLLSNPVTKVDSLSPISDAFKRIMPDPRERNIVSSPTSLVDVQVTGEEYDVLVFVTVSKINPKDENEEINVAKRGGRVLNGPRYSLGLHLSDDTDNVYAKVGRFDYEEIGKPIINRGRAGKSLYAIKGTVPRDFRMINVKLVRYIGDIDPKFEDENNAGGTSSRKNTESYGEYSRASGDGDRAAQAS